MLTHYRLKEYFLLNNHSYIIANVMRREMYHSLMIIFLYKNESCVCDECIHNIILKE